MENLKLYKKLLGIMSETKTLEKNLTVGKEGQENSYKAVGESEVLNMLKPLFLKHKIVVFPVDGDISETNQVWESDYKGQKQIKTRNITQLKVNFKIVDVESGESEILIGFGNGADSQDKGSGKAFTYAYKTMLSKTFMMFSGEDSDNTHSDDIGKSFKSTEKENTKWNKEVNSASEIDTSGKATKEDVAKVFRAGKKKKELLPDFDVFKFIDEIFDEGKITNKYPYADKEKTQVNWTPKDIETLMADLERPF